MTATTIRSQGAYNATAISYDADGRVVSRSLVELDGHRQVRRCNGHWSSENGTDAYEDIWLNGLFSFVTKVVIVEGTHEYRRTLACEERTTPLVWLRTVFLAR